MSSAHRSEIVGGRFVVSLKQNGQSHIRYVQSVVVGVWMKTISPDSITKMFFQCMAYLPCCR